jgi:hypothetical protein
MYKNKSKYSELTAEERERIKHEKHQEWNNKYKEKITEEQKQKNKLAVSKAIKGRCEICEKEYGNIYQHKNTKKHKKREEEISQTNR